MKKNVLIMGAAGRDFHNFNVYFRDNEAYDVKAFTATQIPNIDDRKYPKELAGTLYPKGISIYPEEELAELIKKLTIHIVVFAYSDQPHEVVMNKASLVNAAGADFWLMGYNQTALRSIKPVISVCAVRTGSGKSQTSRKIVKILTAMGKKVVAIRHPMPYGNLAEQAVQRFATLEDLKKHKCTIEEMEEYEPYIAMNAVIYAGVDYEKILRAAEKEADIILWDGGNNDTPFYFSDMKFVVADPTRPYHEISYYPGETNIRMADYIIINKEDSANLEDIMVVRENCMAVNPKAIIIDGVSPIFVENPEIIQGKKVLVVEDGPTLTHGELSIGAGYLAAKKWGAQIVDPRPYTVGSIKEAYTKYPQIEEIIPALGYSDQQIKELEETINAAKDIDAVVIGTPIDLRRIIKIKKPSVRVYYELEEIGEPKLEGILKQKFGK
ncbi:cyclic 2,3-diphosphoglycerate synthase [bacterium]|nr:cyclic 2,3-diphosphoglycerate synthase [bacterium]